MRRSRLLAAAAVCSLAALTLATPASAGAPTERGHYEGSDPPQPIGCEDPIVKSATYWGSYSVRTADGTATLVHDTFKYTDTYTNTETGESFTVDGHVNLRQTSATPLPELGPMVYEFRAANAAQAVLRDSDGGKVTQGAGRVTARFTLDLATGELLEGPELVPAAGHHPLLAADWCEISAELIPSPA